MYMGTFLYFPPFFSNIYVSLFAFPGVKTLANGVKFLSEEQILKTNLTEKGELTKDWSVLTSYFTSQTEKHLVCFQNRLFFEDKLSISQFD